MSLPPQPNNAPSPTRLSVNAAAQAVQLKVDGFVGLPNPTHLSLSDDKGDWSVRVPKSHYPINAQPGDLIVVSLSLVRIGVEQDAPSEFIPHRLGEMPQ